MVTTLVGKAMIKLRGTQTRIYYFYSLRADRCKGFWFWFREGWSFRVWDRGGIYGEVFYLKFNSFRKQFLITLKFNSFRKQLVGYPCSVTDSFFILIKIIVKFIIKKLYIFNINNNIFSNLLILLLIILIIIKIIIFIT